MSNKFTPTEKPENIYGNIVFKNSKGDTELHHVSGGTLTSDKDTGTSYFNRPDGVTFIMETNGTVTRKDLDGSYIVVQKDGFVFHYSAENELLLKSDPPLKQ